MKESLRKTLARRNAASGVKRLTQVAEYLAEKKPTEFYAILGVAYFMAKINYSMTELENSGPEYNPATQPMTIRRIMTSGIRNEYEHLVDLGLMEKDGNLEKEIEKVEKAWCVNNP